MFKFILVCLVLLASPVFLFAQTPPPGRDIDLNFITTFATNLGAYLYTAGIIIIGIALVWTGLIYMTAGSDPGKVKQAKDMLKAALIGALIIFGVGTIMTTVELIASGRSSLFGGGGAGGPGGGGGGGGQNPACLACVSGGQTWCIADSSCLPSPAGCSGLFTQIPAGC